MSGKRKKGYFSISAVAQMLSIHQQTIRMYEREGLIQPKRSEGNTRLFSEEDIQKLEEVIYLTHTAGVNLAGVHIIMKLQKQLDKVQTEVNGLFSSLQRDLQQDVTQADQDIKRHMARLALLAKKRPQSSASPALLPGSSPKSDTSTPDEISEEHQGDD